MESLEELLPPALAPPSELGCAESNILSGSKPFSSIVSAKKHEETLASLQPPQIVELLDFIEGAQRILRSALNTDARRLLLCQWLEALDVSSGDLERYTFFDSGKKYTRNLIATDNETFTLMLLCWTPGKESPIHDHPCEGCWMRVVRGSIEETRYTQDERGDKLVKLGSCVASSPSVVYINDSIGLHKVGASSEGPAMTLHLYAPPFRTCRIWLGEGDAVSSAMHPAVTYHSENGTVIDYGVTESNNTGTGAAGRCGCGPNLCS